MHFKNKWLFSFFLLLTSTSTAMAHRRATTNPPIMGWSSWNTYAVNISDSLICRQADALVQKGLKAAGYRYINIDDGFFGGRDATGHLLIHPTRFPRGLKPVVDHIHSLGLKAGIYSDAGSNTCGSMWNADTLGRGVGLYGHEDGDMQFFMNDCGFDFIKVDFCGGQQLELSEHAQYAKIHESIRKTGRSDINFNVCRWAFPGVWVQLIADSWRTTSDIRAHWKSIRSIIAQNLYLSAFGGNGHYNDMDMLEIGRGLTPEEEQTHFGMWCMMSSPLLIGCDLTQIPESSLRLLTNPELIALNQEAPCQQAYVVKSDKGTYILVKDLGKDNGKRRAVAFYNPTDQEREMSIPTSDLGYTGRLKMRDLIRRSCLPSATESISMSVPPHGVRILSVEGHRIEPTRYEAEWALLPTFNAIGKERRMAIATHSETARCGALVTGIGGSMENKVCWDKVYSRKGGTYKMDIRYRATDDCILEVSINGKKQALSCQKSEDAKAFRTISLPVKLQKGNNKISMGNPAGIAPDLDGFDLLRLGK